MIGWDHAGVEKNILNKWEEFRRSGEQYTPAQKRECSLKGRTVLAPQKDSIQRGLPGVGVESEPAVVIIRRALLRSDSLLACA